MEHLNRDGAPAWAQYLRRPVQSDAVRMHHLVAELGALDLNSTYTYLLLATHFADTSIVAHRAGDLCGFITGYHPPAQPEVLFVWQVAVAPRVQGTGLAGAMLDTLVHRVRSDRRGHPVTVEATVGSNNSPSRALFGGFARRRGVPLAERPYFSTALFGVDAGHDEEPLLRIGPITEPLTS